METDVFFRQAAANPSALMDDGNRSSFDEPTAPLLENTLESGLGDSSGLGVAMHLE
jgi:hypothetical protein